MAPLACCRIEHGAAGGAWNMAFDEALGELAAETGVAALRFYQWSEPTLSLGYFQRADDRALHPVSLNCPMVRRASGGGAILHDRELTYSLAIPRNHRWALSAEPLYLASHRAIVSALAEHGVSASLFRDDAEGATAGLPSSAGSMNVREERDAAFLCFERRSIGDLVIGAHKIGGSAQRRQRGAILQHGSILLGLSSCTPELPGIAELTGVVIDPAVLSESLRQHFATALGLQWRPTPDAAMLDLRAHRIVSEKFATGAWNLRR